MGTTTVKAAKVAGDLRGAFDTMERALTEDQVTKMNAEIASSDSLPEMFGALIKWSVVAEHQDEDEPVEGGEPQPLLYFVDDRYDRARRMFDEHAAQNEGSSSGHITSEVGALRGIGRESVLVVGTVTGQLRQRVEELEALGVTVVHPW